MMNRWLRRFGREAKHNIRILFRVRMYFLLHEAFSDAIEGQSAFIMIMWGLWLSAPGDTFGGSPSYGILAALPEWLWSDITIGFGSFQLLALLHGNLKFRLLVARINAVVYVIITVSFALANVLTTGVPTYSIIAMSNMWASYRLELQVRRDEDAKRRIAEASDGDT